ncbi:MAG TPA: pyrroloquinoline quinone biosynthesis protein PqqE [Blastocatellia bacterium]|nr:pyrroloquinoline quinone biosynthesis protein PqqE [Blastocatellia bacterium]
MDLPLALLAEVTHRCPLHCLYCSNPVQLQGPGEELATEEWRRVFQEARALGVVQLHLSGGEPLARPDLPDLLRAAADLGLYTNLITSGVGLDHPTAQNLADRGLSSVQLSLQAATPRLSDVIGGRKSYLQKQEAAQAIREAKLPMTMNVVLHRHNLDELEEIIEICVAWGAERLELANTQYYHWALLNREQLLPSREQLDRATAVYRGKKSELQGRVELIWVLADYYEPYPKPCMGGWGRIQLTVTPNGTVLPCSAAGSIKTLEFENVRIRSLDWIWHHSPAFNRYRGVEWMSEPCRSCERRHLDFGGCRCQAFALTGDAGQTDPVCRWAPGHDLVAEATAGANDPNREDREGMGRFTYRRFPGGE